MTFKVWRTLDVLKRDNGTPQYVIERFYNRERRSLLPPKEIWQLGRSLLEVFREKIWPVRAIVHGLLDLEFELFQVVDERGERPRCRIVPSEMCEKAWDPAKPDQRPETKYDQEREGEPED